MEEIEPFISIIITAFNEEKNIEAKVINTLELDYPNDKMEIIVASDGSIDRTDEIVKKFKDQGVSLFRIEGRVGKTETQNHAISIAKGEIVIFSDATTVYNKNVPRKIVKEFNDRTVGCVGGELDYLDSENKIIGRGGGAYWRYEKFLKRFESKISSLIGVSGCLYAVRRELYSAIDSQQISDFIIAQQIFKKGYRVAYAAEARSFEYTIEKSKDEFKMRVRVALRSIRGMWYMRKMLNPLKNGFYAIQIISHKLLRYLVPLFLIGLFTTNISLLRYYPLKVFFIFQLLFYLLALIGFSRQKSLISKLKLYLPFYFCLLNLASLIALFKFIMGEKQVRWQPLR
ncbi:MAG: glycosyltransferase family 2 protein [bacterium]